MASDGTHSTPWEGREVDVPLPGGGYQGRGDRESTDIGPSESEYGCAIHCDATDSGTLRGDGAEGGDKGPPKMVGTARDRLEDGAGTGRMNDGSSGTRGSNYGDKDDDDGDTGSGKGMGEEVSLGSSGSNGYEWSGAKD